MAGDQQILLLPIGKYFFKIEKYQSIGGLELSSNAMWRSVIFIT